MSSGVRRQLIGHPGVGQQVDFMPETYMLPKEYSAFKVAFKAGSSAWIWKPNACARGIGIRLITKLDQVRLTRQWQQGLLWYNEQADARA